MIPAISVVNIHRSNNFQPYSIEYSLNLPCLFALSEIIFMLCIAVCDESRYSAGLSIIS